MSRFTLIHKTLLTILILYFMFYGIYISLSIGGGSSPPYFSSLLILNLVNDKPFSVERIGLNTRISGHASSIFTHNLIEINTIDKKRKIYASSLFYLIKEAPQNGIDINEVHKIFNDKIQKRIKEVFLCYLNYSIPQSFNFPPKGWYWVVITEDNSRYFINYITGEIDE